MLNFTISYFSYLFEPAKTAIMKINHKKMLY